MFLFVFPLCRDLSLCGLTTEVTEAASHDEEAHREFFSPEVEMTMTVPAFANVSALQASVDATCCVEGATSPRC